jgi:poly-gamma-glutamate synthesis protein (capsule biosynthesis protein)
MSFKLFVCGDIVISKNREKLVDADLFKIISECDFSICNFEAPIKSEGIPIPKVGPHLNQTIESISLVKGSGFNICSIANNHIYDYGDEGLKKTLDTLKKHGLLSIGAGMDFDSAYQPLIVSKDDIIIGLLSLCEGEFGSFVEYEHRGGYGYINHLCVNELIQRTKKQVNYLVLIVHAGAEDVPLPLPQWRERYRNLCDLGVDVVIGHHPHVPQGYETYNHSIIFYSLGNFFMDWDTFESKTDFGYSVILEFSKKEVNFKTVPHMKKDGIVCQCTEGSYLHYLGRLNKKLAEGYEKLADQQALYLYSTRYQTYYASALNGIYDEMNLLQKCKSIIKQLFFANRNIDFRELLLLHNVRIDSHRYATQHALSLLREKQINNNYSSFEDFLFEANKLLEGSNV